MKIFALVAIALIIGVALMVRAAPAAPVVVTSNHEPVVSQPVAVPLGNYNINNNQMSNYSR